MNLAQFHRPAIARCFHLVPPNPIRPILKLPRILSIGKVATTMCLLGLVFQSIPDYPVVLFANREEDPRRETAVPDIVC